MNRLEIIKISDLDAKRREPDWMIEGLWLDGGVGIIGGEPKSFKTFAALSLAVATASGKDCFGRYAVNRKGPVLAYAAEDSLAMVKERLVGIAHGMGVPFSNLNIHLISEPRLRIDHKIDCDRLESAIRDIGPVLLLLDPFVRLHGVDENSSGEVAKVLSWLRHLQRQHNLNVAMVHHARKRAGKERPGQSLRGSSELHAWGDSNLYLRRSREDDSFVELTIEHRAAPSDDDVRLRFVETDMGPHLSYDGGGRPPPITNHPSERILQSLEKVGGATGDALRKASGMKAATFWSELRELTQAGEVSKDKDGRYRLADKPGDPASLH